MHKYEKYIKWSIIGLLVSTFIMPLLVGRSYLFPFVFPKGIFFTVIVEIAFLLYILLLSIDRKYLPRFKGNWLLWAMLFFFLALMLSTFFGVDPANSFWSKAERMDGLYEYIHYVLFAIILVGVLRSSADWMNMLRVMLFFGVVTAFVSLYIKYAPNNLDLGQQNRLGGTFGNPDFLSTYFLALLFIAVIFALHEKQVMAKVIYWAVSLLNLILVFFSGSRGAVLGIVAGVIIFFAAMLVHDFRKWWRIGAILLVAGTFLVMGALIYKNQVTALNPGFGNIYDLITSVQQLHQLPRFYVWKIGLVGFTQKPIFGWGLENFIYIFNKDFDPTVHRYELSLFDRSHNKIVDILSMTGTFGIVSYLALWVVLVINLFLMLRRKIGEPIWVGGLLGLVVGYFVQNVFLFEMPTSNLIWFFLLAFFIWMSQEANDIWRKSHSPRLVAGPDIGQVSQQDGACSGVNKGNNKAYGLFPTWVMIPALVAVSFSLWVGVVEPARAAKGVVTVSQLLSEGLQDPQYFSAARTEYERDRNLDTYINRELDVSISRRVRETFDQSSNVVTQSDFKKLSVDVMNNLQIDVKRHPMDYDSLIERGDMAFLLQSAYPEFAPVAEESWTDAKKIAPKREDAYHQLALWYASQGQFAKADDQMKDLFNIINDVGRYWWFKTVVDLEGGKSIDVIRDDLSGCLEYGFAWNEPSTGFYVVGSYVRKGDWNDAATIYDLMLHTLPHDKPWTSDQWSNWGETFLSYATDTRVFLARSSHPEEINSIRNYFLSVAPDEATKKEVAQTFPQ